jgi:hypothetical protein
MAYIRSDEDYYRSLGIDPKAALARAKRDLANSDEGYCNPIKAKFYAEAEETVKELERVVNGMSKD